MAGKMRCERDVGLFGRRTGFDVCSALVGVDGLHGLSTRSGEHGSKLCLGPGPAVRKSLPRNRKGETADIAVAVWVCAARKPHARISSHSIINRGHMNIAGTIGNLQPFEELMTAHWVASRIFSSGAAENFNILEILADEPWPHLISGIFDLSAGSALQEF